MPHNAAGIRVRRPQILSLEFLRRIPVITEESIGFYTQNCMICFHHNGHGNGVVLRVEYDDQDIKFSIRWQGSVTKRMLRAFADLKRATDNAACAIALLLVPKLTEYTAIEQAVIGTTIDYYLLPKERDDDLIFNDAARLEVSGILTENEGNTVQARANRKLRRLNRRGALPTFIVVVEFGQPWSMMVEA